MSFWAWLLIICGILLVLARVASRWLRGSHFVLVQDFADMIKAQWLERRKEREPQVIGALIEVYQRMLGRLRPDEHSDFRAELQVRLGDAYADLLTGDRAANLAQAFTCYREALRVYTPEAAPFEYASIQNNLGEAYQELPTGDREQNLRRAIRCYEEALRFWTPDTAPLDYAMIQNNLGNAYAQLPTGDREANLAQAIECYQETLRFWTPDTAPLDYAATLNNLGSTYALLPTGDRGANLAQAIACYQEALRFRTPETVPFEYAELQNNLGNAYRDLPTGDRGTNLARAIEHYQEALRFRTLSVTPFDYAMSQNNLGIAYDLLPTGDRGTNLARAIKCYQEALGVYTPEVAPQGYANAQNNLALAYAQLPTGDRRANLTQALECYQDVLHLYTPEATPFDYARTQNNLGNVYRNLPTGDRGANLMQAIKCYQEALRIYTPPTAPLDYAATQNNLGITYAQLPIGERETNLTRAIECYQEALRFRTPEAAPFDYAMTQNNLGIVYSEMQTGDRGANLAQAIECYQQARRFWSEESAPLAYAAIQNNLGSAYAELPTGARGANLAQAIECYQQALRFWTPDTAPLDYAASQNNLGQAYHELPAGDHEANLAQAITCFKFALRIQTLDAAPRECRQTNRNLADLYFEEQDWSAALAAYRVAMEAGERLYRAGLSTESKRSEVAENVTLYQQAAFAAARLGNTTDTLLILERGKTRLLAEALRLRVSRSANVPNEVWATFLEAGAAVRASQFEGTTQPDDEREPVQAYAARVQAAQDANAALDAAIMQVREYVADFLAEIDLPTVQALISDEQTLLVAFCITNQGSMGLLSLRHQAVQMVEAPNFTLDALHTLIGGPDEDPQWGGWIGGYQSRDDARWHSTIDQVLAEVGQKLLAPIIAALPEDIERLILLPSGGLFLLPLHTAPLSDDGKIRLCDRYQVSYAPSAEVLADLQAKVTRASGNDLYAVINPEEDPKLPFTPAEGAAISSLFAERQVLMRRAGTKEAVMNGVRGRAYLHFSCHGTYNWDDPPASALALADGRLTLAELQSGEVDMSAARLVTLSACETGMTDIIKGSPEEYVGLPAGFMLAGVPCVVASLWAVRDISTALLMERFYRNHLESGMDFVAALHEAQQWLRHLPIGEVAKYAKKCFRQAKRKDQAQLFTHMNHYQYRAQQNPNERPFAHPYYWAAFTVNGI